MKIQAILLLLCFTVLRIHAQGVFQHVDKAFATLSAQEGYQHANISFTLIDIKTGKLLYALNKDKALAPASTLKTFTTSVALNILGEQFKYQTRVIFKGVIKDKTAYGQLIVYGSGDPSFGSERFAETKPELIKKQILTALQKAGIQTFVGDVNINSSIFIDEGINTGWLDEDVGNYYGAGIYPLNWKENKFEINMVPTQNSFQISSNNGGYDNQKDFCIELVHKDGATTEEAFAFITKNRLCMYEIKGVLSNKEKIQNMQLARLHPDEDFKKELIEYLKKGMVFEKKDTLVIAKEIPITTFYSPPLSKLVYWCNQKSLNLYAESFCKTVAVKLFKKGSWPLGISGLIRYAHSKGIMTDHISLKDGCGLAPENRITTAILAQLLYKNTREKWYKKFYESLPSINGLIMKSGYIGGTRSYAGYIQLKDKTMASFAFIVNNYTCTPREVKVHMFQILDLLK